TRRATTGEQQSLALEFASPTPFVPVIIEAELQTREKPRSPGSWMPEVLEDSFFEPQPTGRAELPEPAQWARRYGQAWLEASLGRRPIKQLNRWSSPGVLAELASSTKPATSNRKGAVAPGSQRTRQAHGVVSGMRVDEPADGVAEVAAVVRTRGRCRALMLRLEGWDGRWVCTYAALV
ncbi:MAG: Rv3235 family protein, partial [Candidatus Nanopelagicales bacterium]